jgi:superfamily II DNA/RNA helicase
MSLTSLGLSPALLQAAALHGIHNPTEIQSQAIPPILQGRDLLARAQTGSGKTLAYGLPLLHQLAQTATSANRPIRALVLVPTRELALQAGQSLRALANHLPQSIRIHMVYGGVSINPQMQALRGGTDILLATPGRLLDLIAQNAISLAHTETLVLDEADRMLDLGFAEELAQLLKLLPTQRQNLFFSATFAPAVQQLAHTLLQDPLQIEIATPTQDLSLIHQRAIQVDTPRRTQLLRHLITTEGWSRVLVFVATKLAAEIVADKLRRANILAEPFHGELSQGKRNQVLADFKASRVSVVVATDMAARGLDIAELPVVLNFDLPRSTTDYTHRIGRTGRAGASGLAVSFVSPDQQAHFALIQKRNALAIALETVAGFEPSEGAGAPTGAHSDPHGGIKGKRPSKKDKLRAQTANKAD